jgi:hypothetical protein
VALSMETFSVVEILELAEVVVASNKHVLDGARGTDHKKVMGQKL